MNWAAYTTGRNTPYKHCVILTESNWAAKSDIQMSAYMEQIRGWLIGQHLSPTGKDCILSAPNGIIMFKEESAQTMFLLHWSGNVEA